MSFGDLFLYGILLLILFGALKRYCARKRLKKWKQEWMSQTDAFNSNNPLIQGIWKGGFDFARNVNHNPYPPEDSDFEANFTEHNGAIVGEITDSLGHAAVTGVINYPSVHFIKAYDLMSDKSTMRRADYGRIYYEGTFGEDGTVVGDWFIDPFDRSRWCGSWKMKH